MTKSTTSLVIAKNLSFFRFLKDLTLAEAARKTKHSINTLMRIEQGEEDASSEELAMFAEVYGVAPKDFSRADVNYLSMAAKKLAA